MYKIILSTLLLVSVISSLAQSQIETSIDTGKVYTIVETQPQFSGGDMALTKFFKDNIHFSKKEMQDSLNGVVLIRFIINKEGEVSHVILLRGLSTDVDEEIVRVVKLLPKFTPGMQQGKMVNVYFNLPIVFKSGSIDLLR